MDETPTTGKKASPKADASNGKPASEKTAKKPDAGSSDAKALKDQSAEQLQDLWLLEDVYPDVAGLLSPSGNLTAADEDAIVVLDTNALLLPFKIGKGDLPKISSAYERLINAGRLFVPERVLREFIKNRDRNLAEIIKSVSDKSSGTVGGSGEIDIPPLLAGLVETKAVTAAATKLREARRDYLKAVGKLVDLMKAWRGNDPIIASYYQLFQGAVVVDLKEARADIQSQWQERLRRQIPPGYKDGGKPDTGVGDFLIWLTILKLGEVHQKNLIFVTGEEKADWFVRGDKEGIYPRPELMDEYRRRSGGKKLQLSKLADVLADMNVPAAVVNEVRQAEAEANNAVHISSITLNSLRGRPPVIFSSRPVFYGGGPMVSSRHRTFTQQQATFDYSLNDGQISVGIGEYGFLLTFSKASDRAIHLYQNEVTPHIARANGAQSGDLISFQSFDHSSRTYQIPIEGVFLARNTHGNVLAGRILHIADDTRGAERDQVTFAYNVSEPNGQILVP